MVVLCEVRCVLSCFCGHLQQYQHFVLIHMPRGYFQVLGWSNACKSTNSQQRGTRQCSATPNTMVFLCFCSPAVVQSLGAPALFVHGCNAFTTLLFLPVDTVASLSVNVSYSTSIPGSKQKCLPGTWYLPGTFLHTLQRKGWRVMGPLENPFRTYRVRVITNVNLDFSFRHHVLNDIAPVSSTAFITVRTVKCIPPTTHRTSIWCCHDGVELVVTAAAAVTLGSLDAAEFGC